MSLLNLNSPSGRGPRSKKSLKMWMGAGLLVAVMGIGSTLAANITLNSPGGQTEFGQGISQTVYCGGDQTVTVAPTSTYSNASNTVKIKVVTPGSDSPISASSGSKQTINMKDGSSFPKWLTRSTSIPGFWLTAANGVLVTSSYPSNITAALTSLQSNSSLYYFAPEVGTNTFRKGSSSTSWVEYTVQISDDLTNFKLGGVVISNIPSDCKDVNFVLTGYSDTGSAQTLATGVTLVAAKWGNKSSRTDVSSLSKNRVCLDNPSSSVMTASETSSTLEFTFKTGNLSPKDLSKLVVETQEDALATSCS